MNNFDFFMLGIICGALAQGLLMTFAVTRIERAIREEQAGNKQ